MEIANLDLQAVPVKDLDQFLARQKENNSHYNRATAITEHLLC